MISKQLPGEMFGSYQEGNGHYTGCQLPGQELL